MAKLGVVTLTHVRGVKSIAGTDSKIRNGPTYKVVVEHINREELGC
jgi:hypothetical protein